MKVSANIALSLDGRYQTPSPRTRLGSQADLRRMKQIRGMADAILVGGNTFRDWPIPYETGRPAINAVLTKAGIGDALPLSLIRWQVAQVQLLALTSNEMATSKGMDREGLELITCAEPTVEWALGCLERLGVSHVLCEGGGSMLLTLIRLKRLTRLYVTICPKLIGEGAALLNGFVPDVDMSLVSLELIESEVFAVYDLNYLPDA